MVPDQPASARTRTARLAVCGTQWSLCLLRHHGKYSATTGVSQSSREDLAQVAGTTNARKAAHMGQLQRVPRPSVPTPIAYNTQAFQPYTSGSTGRPKGAIM